jgi:hypothetical protein
MLCYFYLIFLEALDVVQRYSSIAKRSGMVRQGNVKVEALHFPILHGVKQHLEVCTR